jgi:hypothetical protein
MRLARTATRLFFAGAVAFTVVTILEVPAAEARVEEATCADGDRKLCARVPLTNGGEKYFYYV